MSTDLDTSMLSRTTKPTISSSVTRLQKLALRTAVERCVLSGPDIEAARRILGKIASAEKVRLVTDDQPVRIVLYADEAVRVAKAVSAARDAHSAHGALNWVGGRRQKAAALTVLHNRITGAVPYPHLAHEGESR